MNSNDSRVCIVTGATGAIGKAIARNVAAVPGHSVVLVGRDAARSKQAVLEIIRTTGNQDVRFELADLSLQSEIQALAHRWQGPLHVLVNNAAVTPRRRLETPDGLEMQFATNVMGYFWMIRSFEETLVISAPSRIVNIASYWVGDLDIDDLQFQRRPYRNGTAYRQSKQANRMLTVAFSRKLAERGIAVNVCHAGDVNSKLSNDLGFGGHESPDQGAETPVWLATGETGQLESGKYFENGRAVPDRYARDDNAIEELYAACLAFCD
jgi:NAD(P)-dependent dehydrogenase (short-subunit alcohol dehydrogenase family)